MNTKPLGPGPMRSPRIASLFYPLRQYQHHPRLGYRGRYPPQIFCCIAASFSSDRYFCDLNFPKTLLRRMRHEESAKTETARTNRWRRCSHVLFRLLPSCNICVHVQFRRRSKIRLFYCQDVRGVGCIGRASIHHCLSEAGICDG